MSNPWLAVSLSEYEQHMGSDNAQQLAPLSDLFAEALNFCLPSSVAVLGVAGGNGLERIDSAVTKRVSAIDVNPDYLDCVKKRFKALPGLELYSLDLAAAGPEECPTPAELCHAALIFEHAGTGKCLANAVAMVSEGGHLSVVLQLPSETEQGISTKALPSIQSLRDHFSLINRTELERLLQSAGFRLVLERTRGVVGGKALWLGVFARIAESRT